jgi:hypothetical protein
MLIFAAAGYEYGRQEDDLAGLMPWFLLLVQNQRLSTPSLYVLQILVLQMGMVC